GEDSGKVVIWNMAPVLREEDEKNETVPKMLCQMDNHLDTGQTPFFSENASRTREIAGTDVGDPRRSVCPPHCRYIGPSTVFGSSSKLANVEQWRCVTILRSHTGGFCCAAVLSWTQNASLLETAACAVQVVSVYEVARRKIITTLQGHTGLVKGLTWDPVGKYIASQADDRSLKVWRTMDWQLETSITKPFNECGGTTHVLRLSWSPDGQYLVSAHAMNNSGPTAQIIERDGWKTNMDFVGHRKAVTVVKFNPKIFKKKQKNGSSPKPSCPYCCCAVGSKDRSVSVWLTCLKRPLVVIHDLFDKSIMDITWTLNGLGILVCSMDGSVAFLDFSQDELGDPLNEDEKNSIHQNIYGKSLAITTEAQLSTTIIENPEMLKYQQEKQVAEHRDAASREAAAPKLTSVVNGESLEDIRKNLLKKQVETRTADGRRRITPLCIAQLDTGDFSPALFNSVPILPGSSMSSQLTPQLTSSDSNTANSLGLKPSQDTPPAPPSKPPDEPQHKDGFPAAVANSTAMKTNLLLTTAAKIEPMKALDSRFTERSKATPGVAVSSPAVSVAPLERVKDAGAAKESRVKEETSSDSEDKMAAIKSLSKRKGDAEGAEVVEKRKKGRPRKDSAKIVTLTPTALQLTPSAEKEPSRVVTPMAVLKLPTPTPQKAFTLQISSEPSVYIEVENEVSALAGAKLCRLKCHREGREWDALLPSRIITAAGSCDVICVACEDRTLSVFSACGRRLLPAILLQAPMSALHCAGFYVMALTACATLSVWDVQKQCVVVKNESLQIILSGTDTTVSQSFLTQQGVPVISLSNGKSYCFNTSLETWNLIADKQDSLAHCADYRNCLPSQEAMMASGPLAVTQGRTVNAGRQASRLSSTPHHVQQGMTLAFLENQLASALILKSSQEYRHWLLIYARFLVNEGSEYRLRELCKDLLGPVHKSTGSVWEATVLGLRKRDLLREVLPVIGVNLRFQRLFTEYQDQLELFKSK
ncbi:HIRA protein, partial [Atractosteus spatula]|nr:HIRA protein [Atractosteus spatula]